MEKLEIVNKANIEFEQHKQDFLNAVANIEAKYTGLKVSYSQGEVGFIINLDRLVENVEISPA